MTEATTSKPGASSADEGVSVVRVLPLYLVVFAGFVGYSLMIAIFTPLVLRPDGDILPHGTSTGARTIALGILLAVYPLAQFLAAPGIGALSDRFGRKRTLLVSLAACCASYALIGGAVQARTLWLLIVACFVAGLTEANVTVAQSAVADIAPVRQRSRLFGYVYLSSSLAYVIGPLGGGRLADRHLVGWFDYATPFWAVTALLLVILAFTAVAFRETAAAPDVSPVRLTAAFRALGTAFRPGPLRHLYAANFVLYLAIFGFFRVYPMYLIGRFHMDVSQESLFVAWVAVPIVAANLGIVGWLSRRLTPRQMVARIAPVLAAGLVAIVIPHTRDSLWVTLAVTALAVAICLPAAAAMISQAAPSDHQGSALGSNQSLQVGAEALTGVAGGLLAAIAVGLPLVTMAVLAAATAVLLSAQRVGTRASEV